jgi:outer membrane lipoprotein-sorting protein
MRIMLALVVGLFVVSSVLAQEVAAPVEAAAAAEEAVTEAAAPVAAAVEQAVAAVETAQEITIKGRISVVKELDGSVRAIYINPEMGHGYKVDLQNGEGKTLADKHGKTVEVTGMDVNMLFQVKTITVLD